MNTNDSNNPPVPPPIPVDRPRAGLTPLGSDPADCEPIASAAVALECLLRNPRRVMYQLAQPHPGRLVRTMVMVAVVCGLLYGVVVGAFSMGAQLWAAPLKVALGSIVAALICLPSLYIFSSLSGSRARLIQAFGLLVGLVMVMAILLVGFAPVAWLFSQSTESALGMGALHLLFLLVSLFFGARFLKAGFVHAGARSTAGVNAWILVFILVVLQMTTSLRPLVGTSDTFLPVEKKFFLRHWCDNLSAATRAGD